MAICGTAGLVPKAALPLNLQQCKRLLVFPHSHHTSLTLSEYSHLSKCEGVSHCGFNLHSMVANDAVHFFHVLIGNMHILLEEMSIHILVPIFPVLSINN